MKSSGNRCLRAGRGRKATIKLGRKVSPEEIEKFAEEGWEEIIGWKRAGVCDGRGLRKGRPIGSNGWPRRHVYERHDRAHPEVGVDEDFIVNKVMEVLSDEKTRLAGITKRNFEEALR